MACYCKNTNPPALCCTGSTTCEKACVEVKRVFDACLQQNNVTETLTVDLGEQVLATVTSVCSQGESTIDSLVVTPLPGTPNSRVTFTITTPITVTGTNTTGETITGTAEMTFPMDIILRVPQSGVVAPQIEATVSVVGAQNTLTGTNTVQTSACVTIITKVVAEVILVVPTYGYPCLPSCQEYTQDICSGVFNTPVFPR